MLCSALLLLSVYATAAQAGKRGIVWTYFNAPLNPGLLNTGSGEVVSIYDYETYPPPSTNGAGGLQFIGMQRCLDCDSSPIADLYTRWEQQQWQILFTLNEPDTSGISPADAARWYIKNINHLPIKKTLPAVTSSTLDGQGLKWLSEMVSSCNSQCDFTYINIHWYGASFSQFQDYIESVTSHFPDHQIVITEFALQNPPGGQTDQIAFFRQAFSFLDAAPYVALYFPFIGSTPSLFEANDAAGSSYVGTGSCLFNDDLSLSAVGQLMVS